MMDSTLIHEIIRVSFDRRKPSITFESDWSFIIIVLILISLFLFLRRILLKQFYWHALEVEISGSPKAVFKVERNNENLYIANRIYVELTTRKAAITIDENNDVVEEIYNSWYELFGIIRDELKALPGKYLKDHDATQALIGLSRKILNEGLRPHLTEYQAKFRRWLKEAQEDPVNKDLSPQELQKKYPEFQNLITSMKEVNRVLIEYADQLDKLIKGK
ncbi:hypothetical protein V9K67_09130 [Paraflavisolibacter sp. H34]|uniref:hypothetical protein n=1 Tax=Huijunlia imazamoxiresistens TaxID=3127457 RepID=UPI0030184708